MDDGDEAVDDSLASAVSFSVANINPGTVRSEYMVSILALLQRERGLSETIDPQTPRVRFDQFYSHFAGPYLDDERNRCVLWFLEQTQSDYLVFIDSDIAFEAPQPYELVELAHRESLAVLSGLYFSGFNTGLAPLAYHWLQDDADAMHLVQHTYKEVIAHDSPTMPVGATGAGFLAISRALLLDMKGSWNACTPWFAEIDFNGTHLGEDMTFCVRAAHAGHVPHLAPGIKVDHYKVSRIHAGLLPSE